MLTTVSSPVSCDNCQSKRTPLWRKIDKGKYLCNACGLYQKIHQVSRPLHLCKEPDQIKRRKKRKVIHSGSPSSSGVALPTQPAQPPSTLPAESPVPYTLGDCFTAVLEPGEPLTPVCCRGFLVDSNGKIWIFASYLKLIPNVSLGSPISHPIASDLLVSRLNFTLPASLFFDAPQSFLRSHHKHHQSSSLPSFSQVLGSVQLSPQSVPNCTTTTISNSHLDEDSLHLSLYSIANRPPPSPVNANS